jgi:hypothetical protein
MTRLRVTAAVALVAVAALSAALPEAQAGPKAGPDVSAPFYVTLFTPTRGQQMLPDLSDPGANNVITIRFSTFPLKRDVLDGPEVAGVTGLSARCWFRDQAFRTIKVTAFVRRNVLTIDPFSIQQPVLPQGAYRLTLRSSIRSLGGRLLNDGRSDFNTFFTVGTPPFPPVFLRSTPADAAPCRRRPSRPSCVSRGGAGTSSSRPRRARAGRPTPS